MDIAIPISARRCTAVLGVITTVVVLASLGTSLLAFLPIEDPLLRQVRDSVVRLTWVDGEGNIPAWYSASLLLICSVLLGTVALAERQHRHSGTLGWLILSLTFAFLSLDETAQLHELSIRPLQERFGTTGFFHYAWIIPAGLCLAIFLLGYLRFLARLPARTRRLFVLAGAIFVGGAIGIEAISGMHASLYGERTLTYNLIVTAEELFEMGGIVIFIYALLDYISHQFTRLGIHVTSR